MSEDQTEQIPAPRRFPAESTALIDGPLTVWVNHLEIYAGTPSVNEPGYLQGHCVEVAEIKDDFDRADEETDDDGEYLDGRKFSPQAIALTKLFTAAPEMRKALLTIQYQCALGNKRPPSERLALIQEAAENALRAIDAVRVMDDMDDMDGMDAEKAVAICNL